MPKTRSQKETLLASYRKMISSKGGYIAVDNSQVDTIALTELKKQLKKEGTNMEIVKNSVFKIALAEENMSDDFQMFTGQTAIIAFDQDPTVVAKMIKEFQKKNENLTVKHGLFEKGYLTEAQAIMFADIPPKEVLISQLMGVMNGAIRGFMTVGNGSVQGFTRILQQLSEK